MDEQGEQIENMELIKSMAVSFYNQLFSSDIHEGGEFILGKFPTIPHEKYCQLTTECSIEETRKALMSMWSLKAPGPDGFQPIFFQRT